MRAAVIPTHNRPGDFLDCVAAIRPQVDAVVAVAHGRLAHNYATANPQVDHVLSYTGAVPNISMMWRMGIDRANRQHGARWVAVLNDDVIAPPAWFDTLREQAEAAHAAGASGWRAPGVQKIAGFAFILDSTAGVKPDERFRWWYSDDAIQRRCEGVSGFTLAEHVTVEHRFPNLSTTGVLRRISKEDKAVFRRAYP